MLYDSHAPYDAAVIGGGVAGLTAAALLSHAGASVIVFERHTIAGGCASFYQRERYRFDVGATLVGGFGARGAHTATFNKLGVELHAQRVEPSMVVHLPDISITRFGDGRWNAERLRAFGPVAESFWGQQERYADAAWDFAAHFPALPVDRASVAASLAALRPGHLPLVWTLGKSVADLYTEPPAQRLRAFIDAQLIITAQAPAEEVDLAYGATALDLAREGTYHLEGGVGAIATALARSARRDGATIAYGSDVREIETLDGAVVSVALEDGRRIRTKRVISAIPIFDLLDRCKALDASTLRRRSASFPERWGAFTVYCGLPDGVVPGDLPLHHQIVESYDAPLGEGNSSFLSFSSPGERGRAPSAGGRAVTISTHTDVALWERAAKAGTTAKLRSAYQAKLLTALERVIPGAASRAGVIENATPQTFAHYTGRKRGLVGGLPQTTALANLNALSHRTPIRGLYLCGDTTFPGQSTVGATLSGTNAARAALSRKG